MDINEHTAAVEVSRLLSKHVSEMRAFRREHGAAVPDLMDAEDNYRNGGPIEHFRAAIDAACREHPELAPQITRLFEWVKWNEARTTSNVVPIRDSTPPKSLEEAEAELQQLEAEAARNGLA